MSHEACRPNVATIDDRDIRCSVHRRNRSVRPCKSAISGQIDAVRRSRAHSNHCGEAVARIDGLSHSPEWQISPNIAPLRIQARRRTCDCQENAQQDSQSCHRERPPLHRDDMKNPSWNFLMARFSCRVPRFSAGQAAAHRFLRQVRARIFVWGKYSPTPQQPQSHEHGMPILPNPSKNRLSSHFLQFLLNRMRITNKPANRAARKARVTEPFDSILQCSLMPGPGHRCPSGIPRNR
jgi:hypothetical protein